MNVFSDNRRAIRFYESVGFRSSDVFKLARNEDKGEVRYECVSDEVPDEGERGLVKMVLSKEEFLSRWSPPATG